MIDIFREDEIILEAQQKAMQKNAGRTFYNLNIDAGAMWSRRLIDTMIEAEQNFVPNPDRELVTLS